MDPAARSVCLLLGAAMERRTVRAARTRPAVLPVSPGPEPRCPPSSQAPSGVVPLPERGLVLCGAGRWEGKNEMRTLATAGLLANVFFFHPHDHLINSHYCPHFMGEDTEAQTREEACPRLRDELRFKFSFLPCVTSAHPFYKSTNLQARAGEPKAGLYESVVLCQGTGSIGNGHVPTVS